MKKIFVGITFLLAAGIVGATYKFNRFAEEKILFEIVPKKILEKFENISSDDRIKSANSFFRAFPFLRQSASVNFIQNKKNKDELRIIFITVLAQSSFDWKKKVLETLLAGDEYLARVQATRLLASQKESWAIPIFLKRWNRENTEYENFEIARAFVLNEDTSVIEALEETVAKKDDREALACTALYGVSNDKKNKEYVIQLLKTASLKKRGQIVILLKEMRSDRNEELLKIALRDRDPKIRKLAIVYPHK